MKTMDSWGHWIGLALLTGIGIALTGCQDESAGGHPASTASSLHRGWDDQGSGHVEWKDSQGGLSIQNGRIVVSARGRPDAFVDSHGGLRIGDQAVSLTAGQQAAFMTYYSRSTAMVGPALDIAGAGAKAGAGITAGVLQNLMEGKTDDASMQATVHAHLGGLSQSVDTLCHQLSALKAVQDQLAAQLPVWRPYAAIDEAQVQDCHHGAQDMLKDHHEAGDD